MNKEKIMFQVVEEVYLEENISCAVPMYENLFQIEENDDLESMIKDYYKDPSIVINEEENQTGEAYLCVGKKGKHLIRVVEFDLLEEFIDKCN